MNRKRYVSAAKSRNSLEQEKKRMRGSLRGPAWLSLTPKLGFGLHSWSAEPKSPAESGAETAPSSLPKSTKRTPFLFPSGSQHVTF